MNWSLLLAIVPVVVLFLYGIDRFSEEVRHAAGERFWTLLQNATRTPARGALAGAAVSAITQSSTATTVIAVGLVNAGAISFLGSIGLVIGANVGTTLTAQLVAFKLTAFAPSPSSPVSSWASSGDLTGSSESRSSTSASSSSA